MLTIGIATMQLYSPIPTRPQGDKQRQQMFLRRMILLGIGSQLSIVQQSLAIAPQNSLRQPLIKRLDPK
jgi:hypothetical protein